MNLIVLVYQLVRNTCRFERQVEHHIYYLVLFMMSISRSFIIFLKTFVFAVSPSPMVGDEMKVGDDRGLLETVMDKGW